MPLNSLEHTPLPPTTSCGGEAPGAGREEGWPAEGPGSRPGSERPGFGRACRKTLPPGGPRRQLRRRRRGGSRGRCDTPPGRAPCVAAGPRAPSRSFQPASAAGPDGRLPRPRPCGRCCSWPRWAGCSWPKLRATPSRRVRAWAGRGGLVWGLLVCAGGLGFPGDPGSGHLATDSLATWTNHLPLFGAAVPASVRPGGEGRGEGQIVVALIIVITVAPVMEHLLRARQQGSVLSTLRSVLCFYPPFPAGQTKAPESIHLPKITPRVGLGTRIDTQVCLVRWEPLGIPATGVGSDMGGSHGRAMSTLSMASVVCRCPCRVGLTRSRLHSRK